MIIKRAVRQLVSHRGHLFCVADTGETFWLNEHEGDVLTGEWEKLPALPSFEIQTEYDAIDAANRPVGLGGGRV